MTIIYRIFSVIINLVALLLAISMVFSIPMLVSSPQTLLPAFIMLAVILYSWFSFRFRREVLQKQALVNPSLRDWVRVNGIVTIIFCIFSITGIVPLLKNPQPFMDAIRNFNIDMTLERAKMFFTGMLVYSVVLLIHILWTFALVKKNKDFFQQP